MRTTKIIFIVIIISFISCNGKRKSESLNEILNDSTKIPYEYFSDVKFVNEKTTVQYEYITREKDSFLNQKRVYINNVLDTFNSRFYNLNVKKTNGLHHSGHIYYRNYLDTLGLKINKNRWVIFYLEQQISKDSIAHKVFVSEDGNNIYYEYSDYENGLIRGYIEDVALISTNEKDSLGEELKRHLQQSMNIQLEIIYE